MSELMTNKILSERHMVDIIVFLHMFGPRSRTEIYNTISTSPRMAKKLDYLEERGIVKSIVSENSKRMMLKLTPLGTSYANAMMQLEVKSGGDLERYRLETVRELMPQYGDILE
ncbi:MAG: hypothetical protein ACI38Y_07170 [Candidatus Methanomethylophilaceae archaeon]